MYHSHSSVNSGVLMRKHGSATTPFVDGAREVRGMARGPEGSLLDGCIKQMGCQGEGK